MNDSDSVQKIDIGGRRLAMSCSGSGSPTVVLETGLGAESVEWGPVQAAVAKFARVCRYDRAGRGASAGAARPRNVAQMVEDLRALLRCADLPAPYLLVGHSFGGLVMRLFAHRYAHDVRGLILVDSMHEEQFEVFAPLFPDATPSEPAALREMRAFWTGGWRNPQATAEGIDFVSSLEQGRSVRSLGDLPLHILTAAGFANQPLIPPAYREPLQRRWDELQRRFLQLSAKSQQSFIRDSGHFVQRDAPHVIAAAIERMTK
jgi:pimeloyl-ACP methyl ester carboxylesterase